MIRSFHISLYKRVCPSFSPSVKLSLFGLLGATYAVYPALLLACVETVTGASSFNHSDGFWVAMLHVDCERILMIQNSCMSLSHAYSPARFLSHVCVRACPGALYTYN